MKRTHEISDTELDVVTGGTYLPSVPSLAWEKVTARAVDQVWNALKLAATGKAAPPPPSTGVGPEL